MKKLFLILCLMTFILVGCTDSTAESMAYSEIKSIIGDNVTTSVTLPTELYDLEISYSSSNPDVFSDTGVVSREEYSVDITLTITFEYYETAEGESEPTLITVTKVYTFVVTGLSEDDDNVLIMEEVYSQLESLLVDEVSEALVLPTEISGVSITYISSNENILTADGVYNPAQYDVEVTFSIILEYLDSSITKTYITCVLGAEIIDDVDYLSITEILTDKSSNAKIEGYVSAIDASGFYLTDFENSIYVYSTAYNNDENFKVGAYMQMTASYYFYDIDMLISLENVNVTTTSVYIESNVISSVEFYLLNSNVSNLYSINGVTVESTLGEWSSTEELILTCSDTFGYDFTVYLSMDNYSLNEELAYFIENMSSETLYLSNLVLTLIDEEFCFSVTTTTEFSYNFESFLLGSTDSISVSVGEKLTDIFDEITFWFFTGSDTYETITIDNLTYVCEFENSIEGTYPVTVKYEFGDEAYYWEFDIIVEIGYELTNAKDLDDLLLEYDLGGGMPNSGDARALVVPVLFTDVTLPNDHVVSDLETAFFGSAEDTGWESLTSYYETSSYGALNITGEVLDVYNAKYEISKYEDKYFGTTYVDDNAIIKEVLEYYDSTVDFSSFDADNDGYIDALYIIYLNDYSTSSTSPWWAYTYEYMTEDYEYYDGVEGDFFVMMSYSFFEEDLYNESITFNCETVIHETGHLLGLTDYYDYDSSQGVSGGIGGGDMMDYNVGDHNAYSKTILGWIDPYLVTSQSTITLESFEQTGDAIIIAKDFVDSYFCEYYIIDFYTPTGLNEFCAGYHGLFSTSGVRIYHIQANVNNWSDMYNQWYVPACDNSYSDDKLIALVEADGNNNIAKNGYSANSDLFQTDDIIDYLTWYDGSSINCTISVISADISTGAKLTFTFN